MRNGPPSVRATYGETTRRRRRRHQVYAWRSVADATHIVRHVFDNRAPGHARTRRRTSQQLCGAFLALALCAASQAAHSDEIFKCVDVSGRVTYQSFACSNGSAIDIAPGTFDPAAAQRLREDASAWQVHEDMRRAAAARESVADAQRQRQIDDSARVAAAEAAAGAGANPSCAYCDGWTGAIAWPYPTWAQRPPHPHPRPHHHHAPPRAPPYRIVVR